MLFVFLWGDLSKDKRKGAFGFSEIFGMALVSHYGNTMFPEDLGGFFGVFRCVGKGDLLSFCARFFLRFLDPDRGVRDRNHSGALDVHAPHGGDLDRVLPGPLVDRVQSDADRRLAQTKRGGRKDAESHSHPRYASRRQRVETACPAGTQAAHHVQKTLKKNISFSFFLKKKKSVGEI